MADCTRYCAAGGSLLIFQDSNSPPSTAKPRMRSVQRPALFITREPLARTRARLHHVLAFRTEHHEVKWFERQRGRTLNRLPMVHMQLALSRQEGVAPGAGMLRLDSCNSARLLPGSRSVEAVVGHARKIHQHRRLAKVQAASDVTPVFPDGSSRSGRSTLNRISQSQ